MRHILTLLLGFLILSCSDRNELKSRLETHIPANASAAVHSVCKRYIQDCIAMYSRFRGLKKTPEAYDEANRNFKKDFPDSYMLKSGSDICKENGIADSAEITTVETFAGKMMADYFSYLEK